MRFSDPMQQFSASGSDANRSRTPEVLWWGRADRNYSRNRIVLGLFRKLGWRIAFFHPVSSPLGFVEACLRRIKKPDLVWVPCFRQRDIFSAALWAKKWAVPLVVDPLISAFQKEVFERKKWPESSSRARTRRQWEAGLLNAADVVVVDTPAHNRFFQNVLGVPQEKIKMLYLSAETEVFACQPMPSTGQAIEVLFCGTFLALQGPEIIARAAAMMPNDRVRWVFLGDGELKAQVRNLARGLPHVSFEPQIDYFRLPARLARAHILLGVFGDTPKADLVIPNKMCQAMALGRPVITRRASAYPEQIDGSDVIGWVPAGDPESLAEKVQNWAQTPALLAERGNQTRLLFDLYFSPQCLTIQLADIIKTVQKV